MVRASQTQLESRLFRGKAPEGGRKGTVVFTSKVGGKHTPSQGDTSYTTQIVWAVQVA